jgi:hypothetical protein
VKNRENDCLEKRPIFFVERTIQKDLAGIGPGEFHEPDREFPAAAAVRRFSPDFFADGEELAFAARTALRIREREMVPLP